MADSTVKKYVHLKQTFFNGTLKGQVNAIHKDRETKPEKVEEFRAALAAGDVKLGHLFLHPTLVQKLKDLGVDVPAKLQKASAIKL